MPDVEADALRAKVIALDSEVKTALRDLAHQIVLNQTLRDALAEAYAEASLKTK